VAVVDPGSPPSARGIQDAALITLNMPGITPERAGNTICEHAFYAPSQGSPPSARGIHASETNADNLIRITPERAGNTGRVVRRRLVGWITPERAGNTVGMKLAGR